MLLLLLLLELSSLRRLKQLRFEESVHPLLVTSLIALPLASVFGEIVRAMREEGVW